MKIVNIPRCPRCNYHPIDGVLDEEDFQPVIILLQFAILHQLIHLTIDNSK